MPSTNYHKFKKLLPDPNEQILNTLGNIAAETYVNTGKLKKGFAILTNERVYFKGKCFIHTNRGKTRKQQAYAVDLQDITATSVVNSSSLPFHIIALLLLTTSIIITAWEVFKLVSGVYHDYLLLNIALPWLLTLVFTLFDQFLSCRLIKISFTGGSLAFDLPWISPEEAEVFEKSLRQACEQSFK